MKKTIRLTEQGLNKIISESVIRTLNEMQTPELDSNGACGLPEGIDDVIMTCSSDRSSMNEYEKVAQAVYNVKNRGKELSVEYLANSSIMKRLQQIWFRYYKEITYGEGRNINPNPAKLRLYLATDIIGKVNNGEYDNAFGKKQ